jgi:DNA-binding NarL/FixJ family response regulator
MRELQRSRNGEAMYASLGRGIRAALDSRVPQLEPPETPAPQETPTPQEQKAEATPPATTPPQEAEEPPARKRKPKKTKIKMQIAEMAALGLPPDKIASRLKLSIAEVELALNLLHRNPHE